MDRGSARAATPPVSRVCPGPECERASGSTPATPAAAPPARPAPFLPPTYPPLPPGCSPKEANPNDPALPEPLRLAGLARAEFPPGSPSRADCPLVHAILTARGRRGPGCGPERGRPPAATAPPVRTAFERRRSKGAFDPLLVAVRRTVRRTVRHVVSRQHVRGLAPEPSRRGRSRRTGAGRRRSRRSKRSLRSPRSAARWLFRRRRCGSWGPRPRSAGKTARPRCRASPPPSEACGVCGRATRSGARSDLRGAAKIAARHPARTNPELVHVYALVLDEPPRRGDVVGSRRGEDGGRAQGHRGSVRVTNASSQKKRSCATLQTKTLFVCFDSNVPFFFFRRTGLELGRFPKIARVGDSKKAPASGSVYARAYENWRA